MDHPPSQWSGHYEDIRRDIEGRTKKAGRSFARSRHPSMASLPPPPFSSASDTVPLGEIDVEGIDASSSRRNRQTYRIYVTERPPRGNKN